MHKIFFYIIYNRLKVLNLTKNKVTVNYGRRMKDLMYFQAYDVLQNVLLEIFGEGVILR